ncbi:hypothetical protein LT85_2148 [Collimonas arenae]|uniref:DUF4148 domain-containing protein n=1 Tax=Collimonas arenae TaxID=279058 RepID=A0A0A1F9Y3_9BURK|nr:DUF4148 domain-containing protein [Collimonas arenae]AIY41306.1 hypothetical protein LT85_2148 [Collimonas arenae]
MKSAQLILAITAASFSLSTAAENATDTKGKTRQQVRQELKQAQHDGEIPAKNADYPPSRETIQRNKQSHKAAIHPKNETTRGVDTHDDRSGGKQ